MAWLNFNEIKKPEKEIKQSIAKKALEIAEKYNLYRQAAFDDKAEDYTDDFMDLAANSIIANIANDIALVPVDYPEDSYVKDALRILRENGEAEILLEQYDGILLMEDLNYAEQVLESTMPPEEQVGLGLHPDPVQSPQGLTWISDDRSWGITKDEFGNVNLILHIRSHNLKDAIMDFIKVQPESVSASTRRKLRAAKKMTVIEKTASLQDEDQTLAGSLGLTQIPDDLQIELDISKAKWKDDQVEAASNLLLSFVTYISYQIGEKALQLIGGHDIRPLKNTEHYKNLIIDLEGDPYVKLAKSIANNLLDNISDSHWVLKNFPKAIPDSLYIDWMYQRNSFPSSFQFMNGMEFFDKKKVTQQATKTFGSMPQGQNVYVETDKHKWLRPPLEASYKQLKKNVLEVIIDLLKVERLANARFHIKTPSDLKRFKPTMFQARQQNKKTLCHSIPKKTAAVTQGKTTAETTGGVQVLKPTATKPCVSESDFQRPKFDFILYLLTELVYHSFAFFDLGLIFVLYLLPYEFFINLFINQLRKFSIFGKKPFGWLPYVSLLGNIFPNILIKKFGALGNMIRTKPKFLVSTTLGALWWLKQNFCQWGGKKRSATIKIWGDEIKLSCSLSPDDIIQMQKRGDKRFPKLVAAAQGVGIRNFAKIVGGWGTVEKTRYVWGVCYFGFIPYPCKKAEKYKVQEYISGDPAEVEKLLKKAIKIWNQNVFAPNNDDCKYTKNKPKDYANDPDSMEKLIKDGELE